MNLSTPPDSQEESCCRMSNDFNILRSSALFAGAPSEIIKLFAYLAKHRTFQAGEDIITMGGKADSSFFLIRGQVEISTMHEGREIIVQLLREGAFFGELALLARFKWFFTARAIEESELIIVDRESYQKVLEQYPEKRDQVTEKIIQLRIARFEEQTRYMLDRFLEAGIATEKDGKTSIF